MAKQSEMLVKPTIEEVIRRGKEGPIVLPASECERFFYYYESIGWRVGKNPMKCWKAALSGWAVRWRQQQGDRVSEKVRREGQTRLERVVESVKKGTL